jgi:hypothetical protein
VRRRKRSFLRGGERWEDAGQEAGQTESESAAARQASRVEVRASVSERSSSLLRQAPDLAGLGRDGGDDPQRWGTAGLSGDDGGRNLFGIKTALRGNQGD